MSGDNYAVTNTGPGAVHITGSVARPHATVHSRVSEPDGRERADVGVLTVLSEEMRAVVEVLRRLPGFTARDLPGGGVLYEAAVGRARAVALQAVEPGQRSAAIAYATLRGFCSPAVIALVGIAGGIHDDVGLGDVVISDQIIYAETRREGESGVRRRGRTAPMSGYVLRRINQFFAAHDDPMFVISPSTGRTFKVLRGPIGSGADAASPLRVCLMSFNDKTLAVETEAGGVAQAFYERAGADPDVRGWLAIRGISDLAGVDKDDLWHDIASRHAAETFERLAPYLAPAN